ncbi:hypothetical protein SBADM41S_11581 [Streptomyces badius]
MTGISRSADAVASRPAILGALDRVEHVQESWSGPGIRTSSSSCRAKPYVSGSAASGEPGATWRIPPRRRITQGPMTAASMHIASRNNRISMAPLSPERQVAGKCLRHELRSGP